MEPVWEAIAWSCRSMVSGLHPSLRHDGAEFSDADAARRSFAGQPLGFRAVCLFLKGGWSEYVHTVGLPTWSSVAHPCPMCYTSRDKLYDLRGFSPIAMPSGRKTAAAYEEACARCETRTHLTAHDINLLRPKLFFDWRDQGSRGRALRADVPEFGLCKGDRLEASASFPDVHDFTLADAPREATWWRPSGETWARRRNPIFGAGTGASIECLAVDWLHCLSLGVFRGVLGHLLHELLGTNPWEVTGPPKAKKELGLQCLKADLWEWYKKEEKEGRHRTRAHNLTLGTLGSPEKPELHTHGAETNAILRYAHSRLLPLYGGGLGERRRGWDDAVGSLVVIMDIIRAHPRKVPTGDVQRFCNAVAKHMRAGQLVGLRFRPKHHLLMEMGARLGLIRVPAAHLFVASFGV